MEVSRVQIGKGFEKEGEVVQLPHNSKLRPQKDNEVFIEDTRKRNKNKDRNVVIENNGKEKVNTPMKSQGSKIFVVKNATNLVVEEEVGTCQRNQDPSLPTLGQHDFKVKIFVVEKEVPFEGSKTRDKEIGVVSIAITPMTWSPKKVGGNKRSITKRNTMELTKVFDNEKEEEIANEQNNHPSVVDIA